LVNTLATDVARRFCADVVIAVDITSSIGAIVPSGRMEVIIKSIEIMYKIFQIPISKADMV
jgi:hypothetical protein